MRWVWRVNKSNSYSSECRVTRCTQCIITTIHTTRLLSFLPNCHLLFNCHWGGSLLPHLLISIYFLLLLRDVIGSCSGSDWISYGDDNYIVPSIISRSREKFNISILWTPPSQLLSTWTLVSTKFNVCRPRFRQYRPLKVTHSMGKSSVVSWFLFHLT